MPLVLVTILLPIVAGVRCCCASARRPERVARRRYAGRGRDARHAAWRPALRRVELPLAVAPVRQPPSISERRPFRSGSHFCWRSARPARSLPDRAAAHAQLRRADAVARRHDARTLPGARPAGRSRCSGTSCCMPVFFGLIGWSEHPATAWRYFVYNFAGGLLLLLATAAFGVIYGSTDVIGRDGVHFAGAWGPWIFAGFAFAFLVKTPVWPLHTWMPLTYTRACRRRWSRWCGRAVEGRTLRLHRHRACVPAGVRAPISRAS